VSWQRRLQKRLYLNDGRTIATLADARTLCLEWLACEEGARWTRLGDLLLAAAHHHGREPLTRAEAELAVALVETRLM
jgi:hypothetical protein